MNLKFLSWQEGKYSDLWIFVHFLAGIVGGSFGFLFNLSFTWAFLIMLVILIGWEIFESFYDIREDKTNKFLDVIVGAFGFLCTFVWLPKTDVSFLWYETFTIIEILLLLFLSIIGWRNYKKRKNK
jgi:hypothetical protein